MPVLLDRGGESEKDVRNVDRQFMLEIGRNKDFGKAYVLEKSTIALWTSVEPVPGTVAVARAVLCDQIASSKFCLVFGIVVEVAT
ncbi:hypothetical protein V1477_008683 [Vespula maculifrons]|uniref:Uncharacterized protein n=1 Tax=Vespula maculifrons TaxID=7453 RepID=A0ABD2CE48_VESMC